MKYYLIRNNTGDSDFKNYYKIGFIYTSNHKRSGATYDVQEMVRRGNLEIEEISVENIRNKSNLPIGTRVKVRDDMEDGKSYGVRFNTSAPFNMHFHLGHINIIKNKCSDGLYNFVEGYTGTVWHPDMFDLIINNLPTKSASIENVLSSSKEWKTFGDVPVGTYITFMHGGNKHEGVIGMHPNGNTELRALYNNVVQANSSSSTYGFTGNTGFSKNVLLNSDLVKSFNITEIKAGRLSTIFTEPVQDVFYEGDVVKVRRDGPCKIYHNFNKIDFDEKYIVKYDSTRGESNIIADNKFGINFLHEDLILVERGKKGKDVVIPLTSVEGIKAGSILRVRPDLNIHMDLPNGINFTMADLAGKTVVVKKIDSEVTIYLVDIDYCWSIQMFSEIIYNPEKSHNTISFLREGQAVSFHYKGQLHFGIISINSRGLRGINNNITNQDDNPAKYGFKYCYMIPDDCLLDSSLSLDSTSVSFVNPVSTIPLAYLQQFEKAKEVEAFEKVHKELMESMKVFDETGHIPLYGTHEKKPLSTKPEITPQKAISLPKKFNEKREIKIR